MSSNITVRMDDQLKRDLEQTLDKMGLTVSAAITAYAKAVVMQQRIPFELTADPFWIAANQQRLQTAIGEYESGNTRGSVNKSLAELGRMAGDED